MFFGPTSNPKFKWGRARRFSLDELTDESIDLLRGRKNLRRPGTKFTYVDDLYGTTGELGYWEKGRMVVQSGLPKWAETTILRHEWGHKVVEKASFGLSNVSYSFSNTAEVAEEFLVHAYATRSIRKGYLHSQGYIDPRRMGIEIMIGGGSASASGIKILNNSSGTFYNYDF